MLAAAVALLLLFLTTGLRRWIRSRHRALAATTHVELTEVPFEVANKTSGVFLLTLSLFAALSTLTLPPALWRGTTTAFTVVGFLQLGVWGSAAVQAWVGVRRKAAATADRAAVGSLGIVGFLLRIVVWNLIVLLTLDNLGINITALVAGLGIGGIAVALALQNVLGDLFASLSITLDRPFVIGDFIVIGEFMGAVEQIGVKSTRLRSLGGEQIIISNADLLGSRVRNYGRLVERRVVFALGVTYETPREKLKTIPRLIRESIERQEDTRFDRCHFLEVRGLFAGVRERLLRAESGLHALHGSAAGHLLRHSRGIRARADRVRLPDPETLARTNRRHRSALTVRPTGEVEVSDQRWDRPSSSLGLPGPTAAAR